MLVSKKYFTTLFIVLSAIITFIVLSYFKFNFKNEVTSSTNFKNLQNGDLILRCGRSTQSFAVFLADASSEFTHIGIIAIENNKPYVIHAVPCKNNILKKETLSEFINPKNTSKFAIYRSNYNAFLLDKVVKKANSFYKNKYEFDNKYDLTTDSKLYCTELVIKAFNTCGANLKINSKEFNYILGKHNIIYPSEFTKAPFFTRII
ncbi:YiiX/YebB-like N1pC/P60 family cysteine hydrolase [uncultured Lutibacter sp.]|uniref:YiiX/YebB-like N1pC/P60 family cysteine hydrolase n=1 Tax=uncultured Lutibacter sp. TaxID=437739 RepID=UPI00260ED7C0|nr:YiiX/YebB-like N1pC/P60 family cysteine hydrolase [uncultured Lutibacter sp.]